MNLFRNIALNPRRQQTPRVRSACKLRQWRGAAAADRWASMLMDRMKLHFLLPVMLTALAFGCSTPKSWGHAGTTHIAVSGPSGERVTGFYVQDGRKVAVSEAVPWTVSVPRLSSLEFRSTDSDDAVSTDLRYDGLTAHAHMTSTLDSAHGTRVEVRNGFVVSTVR
jgi:hypothetical protein